MSYSEKFSRQRVFKVKLIYKLNSKDPLDYHYVHMCVLYIINVRD